MCILCTQTPHAIGSAAKKSLYCNLLPLRLLWIRSRRAPALFFYHCMSINLWVLNASVYATECVCVRAVTVEYTSYLHNSHISHTTLKQMRNVYTIFSRKCMRRHKVWAFDWCFHFYCYDCERTLCMYVCANVVPIDGSVCAWVISFTARWCFLVNDGRLLHTTTYPPAFHFGSCVCDGSFITRPHTTTLWASA